MNLAFIFNIKVNQNPFKKAGDVSEVCDCNGLGGADSLTVRVLFCQHWNMYVYVS